MDMSSRVVRYMVGVATLLIIGTSALWVAAVKSPTPYGIPQAGADSKIPVGWLPTGTSSTTVAIGDDSRITAAISHAADTGNPHAVTKAQVGLGNAENTADADKPISTAQAAAIAVVQSDVDTHEALTITAHGGIVADTDSRLTDARTPTAHATSHKSGGSDAIKLDELAVPTDVTTLNATTSLHGLLPKLGGGTTNFLRADGTWSAPTDAVTERDFTNTESTSISTPASGVTALFVDTDKILKTKDDAGFIRNLASLWNFSTAAQSPAATTRTYITGSKVTVPSGKLQIGTVIRWTFDVTKTAAGTAASTYDIAVGTNGTTADTARVSFTKPAGTAAADNGRIVIEATVRGPLSSSGIIAGHFHMTHNLASTGHINEAAADVVTISSGFDVTVPNLFVGVCVTSGASDALTIQQVLTEVWNL